MKKKIIVVACTAMLIANATVIAKADATQDNFLLDMAEGLNARWLYDSDENTMSNSELIEYRTTVVNEEYSRLSKYADEKFESEKFGLMAKAYIEAIEMQLDAMKYYTELPDIYESEWTSGYNLRAALIPAFVDYYGLAVDESEVAELRSGGTLLEQSDVVSSEKVDEIQGENKSIDDESTEIEIYNNEGIKVVITGMEEPDMFSTKINVSVENLNHHDILVQTSDSQMVVNGNMIYSPLFVEVKSGKTANATIEFYQNDLEAAGIDKLRELSFTVQISDGESYMPLYIGEEKFLTVDDKYQIHEKAVYTDKENIQKVQTLLNQAGYDCGSADGVPGKKTNNALLQFERDHGLPETTDITPELIETLEAAIN